MAAHGVIIVLDTSICFSQAVFLIKEENELLWPWHRTWAPSMSAETGARHYLTHKTGIVTGLLYSNRGRCCETV